MLKDLKVAPFEGIDWDELRTTIEAMPTDRKRAARFVLELLQTIAVSKGQDYGTERDTFANYADVARAKQLPEWHEPANRLCEKAVRLSNLIGSDIRATILSGARYVPTHEDMQETFGDLCWLAAICLSMYYRETYARAPLTPVPEPRKERVCPKRLPLKTTQPS